MARKPILIWPDRILKLHSRSVLPSQIRDHLELIEDMYETMKEAKLNGKGGGGVGLSAIQIGVPLRIVVSDTGNGREVYINPEIANTGKKKVMLEGCLSLPSVFVPAVRSAETVCSYYDVDGAWKQKTLTGLSAQVIQHEVEHLDGKMLMDKSNRNERRVIIKMMNNLHKMAEKKGITVSEMLYGV